jgi:tetratricopeptide (TPR) repeat protein
MRRSPLLLAALLLLACAANAQVKGSRLEACPESYELGDAVDYLDAGGQDRIRGMERNHLNADVENLVKGQTTAQAGGDLRFMVNYVPNHHRALAALMRLAQRERTDTPAETGPLTVRCWMHRATVFSPSDGKSFLLYGIYLARNGLKDEALEQLEKAAKLLPDSMDVSYNLGLIYFDMKDYKNSRRYAQRAYELGFPLPGLRQKLAAAGFPLD